MENGSLALQCGLLQALKMKRANHAHSHERNRNRNGLGQQAALLHTRLQVLYLLMLSTRMLVLSRGSWGAFTVSLKHQGRNQCCSDQLLKDCSPKLLYQDVAQDASIFLQWNPGEAVQRSWRAYGSQFLFISSCLVRTGTE